MASFKTSLPLFIETGVRKKIIHHLNINRVFNMHFQLRNQVKRLFTDEAIYKLYDCPKFDRAISITYTVFKPTRRRYDVMNVVAIVDKFFQDALVEAGKIQDDSYNIVPRVVGIHGGVSKMFPRVDVFIEELECGDK